MSENVNHKRLVSRLAVQSALILILGFSTALMASAGRTATPRQGNSADRRQNLSLSVPQEW